MGVRAVGPAVKRRSSSILKHVANGTATAHGPAAVEARTSMGGTTAGAGAGAGSGSGENRRNRLLNVAMRSKTAAAAVEGNSYEDEVSPKPFGLLQCTHRLGGTTWNPSKKRRDAGACRC